MFAVVKPGEQDMPNLSFILAYVDDVASSTALYGKLLDLEPVESSANFAMFAMPNHVMLGLWARQDVEPAANKPGGIELAFAMESEAALQKALAQWKALGLAVIQPPTKMDFGLTFTVTDPDGHRLRAFVPGEMAVHSQAELARAGA
jgi:predicted enzyme related to lactoylglutathione lyase